jgi:hypothetical protein
MRISPSAPQAKQVAFADHSRAILETTSRKGLALRRSYRVMPVIAVQRKLMFSCRGRKG